MRRRTRRFLLKLLVAVVLVGAAAGLAAWYYIFREVPTHFADAGENFKYGSLGNEQTDGIPYWIWLVLPRLFPEKLPGLGGYASLGLVWEEGKELPVGFSKKTIGFDRVALNCAFCHSASYRAAPADKPTVVAAGPSHQFDPQSYIRFLHSCASDPRFNADNIMREIASVYRLSAVERALYRYVLIPRTKEALLKQKAQFAFMDRRPDWGRGRIDPFNPIKFGILRQERDDTVGNSDMVPVWNLRARAGMSLHWDGLNDSLDEVVLSSAIGDGATRKYIERENLGRMQEWMAQLPPPKYPFAVDAALAARGAETYARDCASCHQPGGARTGQVIPVAEAGTDRHRLDMWTQGAAAAYNNYDGGYWGFSHFRKTDGYVAVPLDGVWLRAPYLHNGSVPTLGDLFEPPESRPRQFFRGYDVFDQQRVGFVSDVAEERGTPFFLFDTAQPGNSNAGHLWGTALAPEEKRALIEYLKTL